jgi:uncharacterized integral membrane protein
MFYILVGLFLYKKTNLLPTLVNLNNEFTVSINLLNKSTLFLILAIRKSMRGITDEKIMAIDYSTSSNDGIGCVW